MRGGEGAVVEEGGGDDEDGEVGFEEFSEETVGAGGAEEDFVVGGGFGSVDADFVAGVQGEEIVGDFADGVESGGVFVEVFLPEGFGVEEIAVVGDAIVFFEHEGVDLESGTAAVEEE